MRRCAISLFYENKFLSFKSTSYKIVLLQNIYLGRVRYKNTTFCKLMRTAFCGNTQGWRIWVMAFAGASSWF